MESLEALHQRIPIVDAHLDLAYDLYAKRRNGRTHVIRDEYLEDFRKGGVRVVVSSLFVDGRDLPEGALHQALGQVGALYAELRETPELALCRSYPEIEAALGAGKIALLLSFEGVEPLGNEEELLPVFYEPVSYTHLTLSWACGWWGSAGAAATLPRTAPSTATSRRGRSRGSPPSATGWWKRRSPSGC